MSGDDEVNDYNDDVDTQDCKHCCRSPCSCGAKQGRQGEGYTGRRGQGADWTAVVYRQSGMPVVMVCDKVVILIVLQEGVVKLDHSGDVKMLQLKYLCKMKSDD